MRKRIKRYALFDVDLTLISIVSQQLIWKRKPLKGELKRKWEELVEAAKAGTKGYKELVKDLCEIMIGAGVTKKDLQVVAETIVKKYVRANFIEAAKYAAKHGVECWLVSANEHYLVSEIMKRLNREAGFEVFKGCIGSIGKYGEDGELIGLEKIVGADRRTRIAGILAVPKTAELAARGVKIRNAVIFSDNPEDMQGPRWRGVRYRVFIGAKHRKASAALPANIGAVFLKAWATMPKRMVQKAKAKRRREFVRKILRRVK